MSIYSISKEQLDKTNGYIPDVICVICDRIPIPCITNDLGNDYCQKCAVNNKITGKIKVPKNCDKFKFECNNKCGATFTYETIPYYMEHESECERKYLSNNACYKCQQQLNNNKHDCIIHTNKKISIVQENLEKNKTRVEDIAYKMKNLEIQVNFIMENLFNDKNKILKKNELNLNEQNNILGEIEQNYLQKFNQVIEVNNKNTLEIKNIETIVTGLQQINDSFFNNLSNFRSEFENKIKDLNIFTEKQKELNKIYNSSLQINIKKDKNEDLNLNLLSLNNLESKLNKLLSIQPAKSENYSSLMRSDTFISNNFKNMFNIEPLKFIENNETFQKEYKSLNMNIDQYMNNKLLFGNISEVFQKAHSKWVYSMVSVDQTLISCSGDGFIKVWNLNTNKLEKTFNHNNDQSPIYSLLVLKDKNIIISGGKDKYIRFWNRLQYNKIDEINNKSEVYCMVEYDDILITGDELKKLNFYDISSNRKFLIKSITTNHQDFIWKIYLWDSKNMLLSGSGDKTIKLWDIQSLRINENIRCESTISSHKAEIRSLLQLKTDNSILVSTDAKGTIVFTRVRNGTQELKRFDISYYDDNINEDYKTNAMFTHELRECSMLVTVSVASFLLFWDLIDYKILRKIKFHIPWLYNIVGLNNDEGIAFSQGNHSLIIWK